MSVEVVLDSPLAQSLNSAIQPKLVEVGWSTGGADDSALSEYIILMLVNGKTQDQIAAELSGDLLNLGPDDPGARDFSQWLFQQVDALNSQQSGGDGGFSVADSGSAQEQPANGGQDADMGDVSDSGDPNVPTGPKSMRTGGGNRPRDKRMLGHLAKAMDRTNDSVLHRIRPQNGNERINSHSRGPPTGPRQVPGRVAPRMPHGRPNGGFGGMQIPGTAAANVMNMTPQQQLELYAMLEQQSRIMAQMLGPQQQQMGTSGPMTGFSQQQNGRSLFDRVQANPQRPQNNNFRKGPQNTNFGEPQQQSHSQGPSLSMDVEMSQEKTDTASPDSICPWSLSCRKKDCPMAHQSPAAPSGTTIDVSDVCSFGAACKNHKCTGRHPSPAQKTAHQTEIDCQYFPNCRNGTKCPFRHPSTSMPPCRNGADCTTPNCKFTHGKTMCKFNPCKNPACTFKHAEGQKRGTFEDKVWVAGGVKEHVSERKFVDEEGIEELIRPGASEAGLSQESSNTAELAT